MLNSEKAKEDENGARIMWEGERLDFVEMGSSSEEDQGYNEDGGSETEEDGDDEGVDRDGENEINEKGEENEGKEEGLRNEKDSGDAQKG